MKIGIIGCGNISSIYIENLSRWPETEIFAVADLIPARAQQKADEHGISRCISPEEMLVETDCELILNLTIPEVHYEVSLSAIKAGKHVYSEKPLALTKEQGVHLHREAESAQVRIGCAPDTVLGAGIQSAKALIDTGKIGKPIGANGFMMCPGHESWHPSPEFYYKKGGGPLFDMGPYYLTALVTLLGPVKSVVGLASTPREVREITSEPLRGSQIEVETPTHIAALLEFAGGAIGQLTTSFDVQAHTLPPIEVYGSDATVQVPDPNGFGGVPAISNGACIDVARPYSENSRGVGVLDMVLAFQQGRPHRASGELALHILDAMESILESSESGRRIALMPFTAMPLPMPTTPLAQ